MDLMLRIPPLVSQPGTLNYQTAKEQLLFSTVSLSHPSLPWYFRTFQRRDDKEEWTSCMENHHYDEKIFLEGGKKKGFK